jgi:hypothetical protein
MMVMTGATRNSQRLLRSADDDFLEQQLQHVGDRLQQTSGADAVRPETHVHPADELAFPQGQVGHAQQDHDGTTRMRTSAHTVGHATPRSWARPR